MSLARRCFRRWLGQEAPASRIVAATRSEDVISNDAHVRSGARGGQLPRKLALLTVTVGQSDLLRMRAALNYSGVHSVEFVRVTPIAGSTRVRVDIALQRDSVDGAMHTILCAVREGEFGKLTAQRVPHAAARPLHA